MNSENTTCVECEEKATHIKILKDGVRPNPPAVPVCENHAPDDADEL